MVYVPPFMALVNDQVSNWFEIEQIESTVKQVFRWLQAPAFVLFDPSIDTVVGVRQLLSGGCAIPKFIASF